MHTTPLPARGLRRALFTLAWTLLGTAALQAQRWVTIRNGEAWTDNRGLAVQAHGGNFLQVDSTFYLIGEDRSDPWHPDVNLYSTTDFQHWTFRGKIIENGVTDSHLGRERFIERPKLLRSPATGKFVVWCHWEGRNYGASEAACFESDSVTGPYRLVFAGRPMGVKSRDCNVFVDNDGAAYFISTTNENQDLGLFRLSPSYTEVVSHTPLLQGHRREAPAMVHIDSLYYMLSSACTGWDANQACLSVSTRIDSLWGELCPVGDRVAFDTQASSILTLRGTEGTVYLYVGDRWMDPDLPDSKIILLPVSFSNGTMDFRYRDTFELDVRRGLLR